MSEEISNRRLGIIQRTGKVFDKMKARSKVVILFAIIFQVAVLVSLIVRPASTLALGETILVKVVPVDPRDLFRGDYVILSYEFSRVNSKTLPGYRQGEMIGSEIYTTLQPGDDGVHWEAIAYSFEPPADGVFLKGKIVNWNRVEYGIESFFVQEGTGWYYEDAAPKGLLSAELAVDAQGKGVLKGLVVAEEPVAVR